MVIRGIVQNGHVLPGKPLDLPDGTPVYILSASPGSPERRSAALARIRARAVDAALPDEALTTDSLYEE